ncbi:MAG: Cyclic di-GMP phosphodiesterase CdgJ [Rhodocyclaceae bacterium]|nr:MAG: EAL domain-containing protein [Rhodocyclaceae bacterium]MBE7421206.1 EAL domain-containing protein [Zoogloeaceae bacterium]MBV6407750.1 Cyclic di-GMP phosphodiesterase CdgJ [Rhodocyclaceae bacterium]CAG0944853.1 Cyclic di-GMP phosphodiesterase CdgJ [Gammaproteobacteria bacterium]
MDTPIQEIFIGRQPILDRNQRPYAYELLFRSGRQNFAQVSDDTTATATVLSHAITELGLEAALGPYLGFINLDARMLMSEVLEMLPREKFVLEVLETVELTPRVIARCRELKELGFTLALDDFVTLEEQHRPLLEMADIVKVELMGMDEAKLAATVEALRQWPLKLLAEKVDSEAQVKHCLALGFELFQGYYFAKPTIIAGKKLSHSELTLNRLLGLILQDADTGELEAIFKPEPGLTLNLMRLTNSAASGVRQKITSVRHALTVLGRRQLQRWLQLLVYADASPSGPLASPLMQLAATRGRFMELMADKLMGADRDLADRAFMTGIMSLMPTLLHVPIGEVMQGLSVANDVREALEARGGILGRMLQLAEKQEEGDMDACFALTAELPGLDNARVNALLSQALAWANSIGQQAD